MALLTFRNTKGSPLTSTELDNNFNNLNVDIASRVSQTGLLAAMLTVDGIGSGLDADTIRGLVNSSILPIAADKSSNVTRDSTGNFTGSTITATTLAALTNVTTPVLTVATSASIPTLSVTTNLTSPAATITTVTGNLTGNSAGVHTGNVTGNLTGNSAGVHTGDVTGNLTGNSAGVHTGTVVGNADTATLAAAATILSGDQTNWATYRQSAVANMIGWKNYQNGHVIFDASNSTSPTGSVVNNTTAATAWTSTYPTLMGWNGTSTYGVRVDSARISDTAANALGVGQTWQDVTAQRVMGTTYTNSTGKPIMLVAQANRSAVSTSGIQITFPGPVTVPICYGTNSSGGNTAVGSIIIPIGSTYVLSVQSEALNSYSIFELR